MAKKWVDKANRIWLFLIIIFLAFAGVFAVSYADYDQYLIRWIIPGGTPEFALETNPSTDIGSDSVTLHGNITEIGSENITVWFEYGQTEGEYIYKTDNETITAVDSFNANIEGIQLFPGTTYYFRAAGNNSTNVLYGDDLSFSTTELSLFTDQNFGANYDELEASEFNITSLATVLPKSYTDRMVDSRIFYGIFFGFIFLAIWIKQEDVTIPALLGMIIGGSIWSFFSGEVLRLAQALFIVSFAGLVYSLIKGRRE